MKILTYIIAALCFILAMFMWSIVGRFSAMYEEVGVDLPTVARALVGTWSWLPTGILVAIGVLVVIAAIRRSGRFSLIVAVVGMICGMAVIIITAVILYLPLRNLSDDMDDGEVKVGKNVAEQVAASDR